MWSLFVPHATVVYNICNDKEMNSALTIASCSSVSRWTFTKVHSVKDQATATVITRVWITWIA